VTSGSVANPTTMPIVINVPTSNENDSRRIAFGARHRIEMNVVRRDDDTEHRKYFVDPVQLGISYTTYTQTVSPF